MLCAAFSPSTTIGFLCQVHQGWSQSWEQSQLFGSPKPFQSLHGIFSPLCLLRKPRRCWPGHPELQVELSPSQNSCRAGKEEHKLNQLAPLKISLQTKTEQPNRAQKCCLNFLRLFWADYLDQPSKAHPLKHLCHMKNLSSEGKLSSGLTATASFRCYHDLVLLICFSDAILCLQAQLCLSLTHRGRIPTHPKAS